MKITERRKINKSTPNHLKIAQLYHFREYQHNHIMGLFNAVAKKVFSLLCATRNCFSLMASLQHRYLNTPVQLAC